MNNSLNEANKANPMRSFLPLVVLFIVVMLMVYFLRAQLFNWKVDSTVIHFGNLILFIAAAVSYYFYQKSIFNKEPYTFLNYIYAGMFFKMILCLFSAFLYIKLSGKAVNKPAIFISLFLYLIYTAIELKILMKFSKQQKNG